MENVDLGNEDDVVIIDEYLRSVSCTESNQSFQDESGPNDDKSIKNIKETNKKTTKYKHKLYK